MALKPIPRYRVWVASWGGSILVIARRTPDPQSHPAEFGAGLHREGAISRLDITPLAGNSTNEDILRWAEVPPDEVGPWEEV